ncbi:MAG TPA: methyl-accepting chemotaxis protein, partial [Desulfomonilia bacterium]|nr:methyl-accepting chemotaxis protein [Desulfomonilia bacterium]
MRKLRLTHVLATLTFGSVAGVLLLTTIICFYNFHNELKRIAYENQEMRIKVFWELLSHKGGEFQIKGDSLLVGDYVVNKNYELPDKLKHLCGGTATIFMKDTRVSTNVEKADGTRAVGTKLQGPAYDAIFKEGKPYRGETNILGTPYFTAYDPIKNKQGEIIGALYAGVKESEFFASYDKLMIHVALLIMGIAVIVAVGVFGVIKILITKPLQNVQEKFRNLAEGDLTTRIHTGRSDEVGDLANEFNQFVSNLEAGVIKIKDLVIKLDGAVHEVSSESHGLSQTTQEQASAIEQVAATIEQMTSSIKQNSMSADEGSSKAKSMVETASANSDASKKLIIAMEEISSASHKIGDIIVTVNEVAFQTNLLALNASVEAARAGEHGRGFAVVAGEVRALAQKSAEAARQIKVLIEDSEQKVRVGDEIVKKSVESLSQMIAYIGDLSTSVDHIAVSTAEQATGVDEVNRALSQIDSTTQQNASTAEELASTSDTLSAESQVLSALIKHYKVSEVDKHAQEFGMKMIDTVKASSNKRHQYKNIEVAPVEPTMKDQSFEEF